MSIFGSLNKITSEIEAELETEINVSRLANMMGTNVQTFERVFSAIMGMSLAEYVRKRRLSAAAADLLAGDKVLDVAVRYGYESGSSFARAFRGFHGIAPGEIKRQDGKTLRDFPRAVFFESSRPRAIEYAIVDVPAMQLVGQKVMVNNRNIAHEAPRLFDKVEAEFLEFGHIDYGMITYDRPCHEYCREYYVLFRAERRRDWPEQFVTVSTPSFKALKLNDNVTELLCPIY